VNIQRIAINTLKPNPRNPVTGSGALVAQPATVSGFGTLNLSDAEWSALALLLPRNFTCNLQSVRSRIDGALIRFENNSWSAERRKKLPAKRNQLKQLASACRKVVDLLDLALCQIAFKGHGEALRHREELVERDLQDLKAKIDHANLINNLSQIANWAEQEALTCKVARGLAGSEDDVNDLVSSLILVWKNCGGYIGGGINGSAGGPLIRFLAAATTPVLLRSRFRLKSRRRGSLTVDALRHRIRNFKRRHTRAEKAPS
jgi:hypothetical protein